MSRIPAPWLPHVPMRRIICHWTAGTHKANAVDKKAYHILVEGDGNVVRGNPSIALNSGKLKDGYAAHTLNCNSDSIGISMCGMAGAIEAPFKAGSFPLTQVQWDTFVKVVAHLADFYEIAVSPKTILFHAEVQQNLGITQKNKWDVSRLNFDASVVGANAVGDKMRNSVTKLLQAQPDQTDPFPTGAILKALRQAPTRSARFSAESGKIPSGTTVELIGIDGDMVQIETPAGYLVWGYRKDFVPIDGPPVEVSTDPDPMREKINSLRQLADSMEALLK